MVRVILNITLGFLRTVLFEMSSSSPPPPPTEDVLEKIICHYDYEKQLFQFSAEELQCFPLSYLTKYARAVELSLAWEKLPLAYRENEDLKRCLPCWTHHSRGKVQVDGPPPPIKRCYICISLSSLP